MRVCDDIRKSLQCRGDPAAYVCGQFNSGHASRGRVEGSRAAFFGSVISSEHHARKEAGAGSFDIAVPLGWRAPDDRYSIDFGGHNNRLVK
jgi:hypothetical protein